MEEMDFIVDTAKESMEHALAHLEKEMLNLRAGKANPIMLASVKVDYYGTMTPISQVANINTPDGRTLTVQPWEKGMLQELEKAILVANLGFNPMNNGESIIINIPPLTEERRKELVKMAKATGEDTKVSMRSARQKAMDTVKSAVKNGYPEDAGKKIEGDIQNVINTSTKKVDEVVSAKEGDIMTV